jgi:4-amino-4-deoxy-L-arabinose transferase-like glycosyltransferase
VTAADAGQPRASKDRGPQLLLALLLVLSAYVQLTVMSKTVVAAPLSADAGDYFSYAWNLREHQVYSRQPTWADHAQPTPDKVRSPGYPLLLQVLGQPQPNEEWAWRLGLLQAAMAVGTVLLTFLVSRRLLGWNLALLAGLLVATNPFISNAAVYVLTETSFAFLLVGAAWLSLRALDPDAGPGRAVAAGLCWAACSLVRPTTQFLPPLLLLGTLLLPAWKPWRRAAMVGTLAYALAMAPWFVRNLSLPPAGPGNSLMVNSIVHGSYPGFMYEDRPETRGFPYRFDPDVHAIEADLGSALGHVLHQFQRRPLRYARWYLLGKPYTFLSLEDLQSLDIQIYELLRSPWYESRPFTVVAAASRALHWPSVLAALAAMLALAWRPFRERLPPGRRVAAVLLALMVAYGIAIHMVAAPYPRYSIPFRPLLYALALLALHQAWLAIRSSRA